MARKKAPAAPPAPTPARVEAALRAGDYANAAETARELHTLAPTAENLDLRKRALAAAAAHFADRDKAIEFNRLMAEAEPLDPGNAVWVAERAALLARGGRLADALTLADDASRPRVLAHAADRAVRVQSKDSLPPDLHAGFDAITGAFRHHEAGNETAAREALEPVGLRSPFLEWKVLLRGLLAHAAADDARAAENFARLDAGRVPATLAAPLRVAVDPAFKESLPADAAAALLKQHVKLTSPPVQEGLRAIAKELGRDRPLAPAFRAAETVVAQLKPSSPELVGRLANCLYQAILHQGDQQDLAKYKALFGAPADDPHFCRLLAQVMEQINDLPAAHAQWQRYEAWLATKPAGWPDTVAQRARAAIWLRMGENARKAAEQPDEEDELLEFFGPPRRKARKPLDPPAVDCFRQAATLAPEWPSATHELFVTLVAAKKLPDAEAVARATLARQPDDLRTLAALANLLGKQNRAADAVELWLRASAVNPLDKAMRFRAAAAVVASARNKAATAPAEAEAILDQHRPLTEEHIPAAAFALRSVLLVKAGKPDEAAAARAKALAVPGGRLGAAYRVVVDSLLAKLKPADRKAADKLFAEELAKPPGPWEVNQLIAAYDWYHVDGVTFRGQKSHDKKVLDQVARCLTADAPEEQFERLGELLLFKDEWKHAKKLAEVLHARFPSNPYFLLARCEAGDATNEQPYLLEQRLRRAKELAEASAEPRHRALLDRIDRLLKQVASPFDFLGSFFGRPR